MTVTLIILCASLIAIGGTAWWARRRVDQAIVAMRDETVRREAALDKQAKVFVRKLERTRRQSDRMIDEAHSLNQTVNQVLQDPRVQRLLSEGKSRGR